MTKNPYDEMITSKQASNILGLAMQTIWRKIDEKYFKKAVKCPCKKTYLLDKDEIMQERDKIEQFNINKMNKIKKRDK